MKVTRRLDVPRRHKVQQSGVVDAVEHGAGVFALRVVHELGADKRRVAQHIAAALGGQNLVPVQPQRIAMHHMRRRAQRYAGKVKPEFFAQPHVHLVVHQPQGHLCDLGGEFFDLDAVELVHVEVNQSMHVYAHLPVLNAGAKNGQLQIAQFAVGDDEKVAAAAGGV